MGSHDLLLVAGEASGDVHGASLLRALAEDLPSTRAFGLGGEKLEAAGMEKIADYESISVVGLWQVLRAVPTARRILKKLLDEVDRRQPAAALLVDFPEFNLRLARKLKQRGVKVIYYVSPQVWAWRRGRLKMIGNVVDKMLVFFGFEVDFYKGSVDVTHVGHPLVDQVPRLPQVWDEVPGGTLPDIVQVALLPGSRSSEIARMLPLLIDSARRLAAAMQCRFVVVRAPSVKEERIKSELTERAPDLSVQIVSEDRFEHIANSHLALCTSGTATLEVGLLGTPMIVVYQVDAMTSLMGRLLIRVPHISLVNLVLGGGVMTELVQGQAEARYVEQEACSLLGDRTRIDRLREQLARLRPMLGEQGASRRAAREVFDVLTCGRETR
jgi:lipid-A-disaccharide synthase